MTEILRDRGSATVPSLCVTDLFEYLGLYLAGISWRICITAVATPRSVSLLYLGLLARLTGLATAAPVVPVVSVVRR